MSAKFMLFPALLLALASCSSNTGATNDDPTPATGIPEMDEHAIALMEKYSVPGMQIAITRQGKLVYAKSFGKADVSANVDVKNDHLFRIASISKPITGIAVMKLVEEGRLNLSDRVFGAGSILGTTYGQVGSAVASITVDQLLHHTSGGWGNSANDPMFSNSQMNADQLITWVLANRPLQYAPGTRYDYSNFGYCVLGRVIEKVTGKSYEEYVKTTLLAPSGITQMSIGGNQLKDRKTGEVVYYGQSNENPYLYNISRMDAHGGWIASATDLLRLTVRVDGFASPPDLLGASTISQMVTASPASPGYAKGWTVNSVNHWWHTGSLPGSSSILIRASSGYSWAVLCNTRPRGSAFNQELDDLVWKVVNNPAVKWPQHDLF